MLIVRQGRNVVMNLDNISCIEVNKSCPVDLTARIQRSFQKETLTGSYNYNDSFFSFYLGSFSSKERTKEVLNELVDAYERGAKVFRVPDE